MTTSLIPADPQPMRAAAESLTPMALLQAAIASGTSPNEMTELYALVRPTSTSAARRFSAWVAWLVLSGLDVSRKNMTQKTMFMFEDNDK